MKVLALLLVSLLTVLAQPPTLSGYSDSLGLTLYSGLQQLNTYYMVYWRVTPPNLHLGIVCESGPTGWCAFGFSADGNMVPPTGGNVSDATIVWVDGTNTRISDFVLVSRIPPTQAGCNAAGGVCPDTTNIIPNCQNNAVLVNGSRENNYTIVEFTRPLAASDDCDMAIDPTSPVYVIYAVGPVSTSGNAFPFNILQHSARAAGGINPTMIQFITTTTAPASTTGSTSSSTTGTAPTTTAPASTTTTAAATTGSTTTGASTTTTMQQSTTGDACPNLTDECRDQCGTRGVETCRCQNGFPSVECASSAASLVIYSALLVIALLGLVL